MSSGFKTFLTTKQVEELKEKRQAEWETVRRPDDPLGAQAVAKRCAKRQSPHVLSIIAEL